MWWKLVGFLFLRFFICGFGNQKSHQLCIGSYTICSSWSRVIMIPCIPWLTIEEDVTASPRATRGCWKRGTHSLSNESRQYHQTGGVWDQRSAEWWRCSSTTFPLLPSEPGVYWLHHTHGIMFLVVSERNFTRPYGARLPDWHSTQRREGFKTVYICV